MTGTGRGTSGWILADSLQITIVPLADAPNGPDRWQRLRLILKALLRRHRWRVVEIRPVDDGGGADPAPGGDS